MQNTSCIRKLQVISGGGGGGGAHPLHPSPRSAAATVIFGTPQGTVLRLIMFLLLYQWLTLYRLLYHQRLNYLQMTVWRAVTTMSSCQVNTTSKRGIKQLGISFGSIFLLFSPESSWGHVLSSWGKSMCFTPQQLSPQLSMTWFSETYCSLSNGWLCGKKTLPLANATPCPLPLSISHHHTSNWTHFVTLLILGESHIPEFRDLHCQLP